MRKTASVDVLADGRRQQNQLKECGLCEVGATEEPSTSVKRNIHMCQVASQNMHGGVGEGACFVLLFLCGLFEGTYRACRFEDLKSADASSRGRFSYSKIAIKQLQRSTEKYQRGHYIRSNEAINAQSNSAFDLCQCLRPTSTSFHIPLELR